MKSKRYTDADVIAAIRQEAEATSQREVARRTGFTPAYINDLLNNRRSISANVAKQFGFEHVSYYVKYFTRIQESMAFAKTKDRD